jgi:hypothetical protein
VTALKTGTSMRPPSPMVATSRLPRGVASVVGGTALNSSLPPMVASVHPAAAIVQMAEGRNTDLTTGHTLTIRV